MARLRSEKRTGVYIDMKKACAIYLKNNPSVKSYRMADLHKDYLRHNPKEYISYRTFISWNKKGSNQIKALIELKDIVGSNTIDELIKKPDTN